MNNFKKLPSEFIFREIISGWGQTNKSEAIILQPENIEQLNEIIVNCPTKSLIARGLGRSYGDASQIKNNYVVDM